MSITQKDLTVNGTDADEVRDRARTFFEGVFDAALARIDSPADREVARGLRRTLTRVWSAQGCGRMYVLQLQHRAGSVFGNTTVRLRANGTVNEDIIDTTLASYVARERLVEQRRDDLAKNKEALDADETDWFGQVRATHKEKLFTYTCSRSRRAVFNFPEVTLGAARKIDRVARDLHERLSEIEDVEGLR